MQKGHKRKKGLREPVNGLTHLAGGLLASVGLIVLLAKAASEGRADQLVAFVICWRSLDCASSRASPGLRMNSRHSFQTAASSQSARSVFAEHRPMNPPVARQVPALQRYRRTPVLSVPTKDRPQCWQRMSPLRR